jgi:hypothetical protein
VLGLTAFKVLEPVLVGFSDTGQGGDVLAVALRGFHEPLAGLMELADTGVKRLDVDVQDFHAGHGFAVLFGRFLQDPFDPVQAA